MITNYADLNVVDAVFSQKTIIMRRHSTIEQSIQVVVPVAVDEGGMVRGHLVVVEATVKRAVDVISITINSSIIIRVNSIRSMQVNSTMVTEAEAIQVSDFVVIFYSVRPKKHMCFWKSCVPV